MTITISHTYAEGTLLDGTTRGDMPTIKPVLRTHGWRWGRSISCWYQQASRDKLAPQSRIEATAAALRDLGYDVEVTVDNTPRDMTEAEVDRSERMDNRADALAVKARRKNAESDAYLGRAHQLADSIPLGQPILVGHHSEKRARRDLERIHNWQHKGLDLYREAKLAADKADTAGRHMDFRYNPETVANRVRDLETDLRKIDRYIDGEQQWVREPDGRDVFRTWAPQGAALTRAQERRADIATKLDYWQQVRKQQQAAGEATSYTREDVAKGDLVLYRTGWYPVARVNKVSVSVPSGYTWTNTVRYEHIKRVVKPSDEEFAAAHAKALKLTQVVGRGYIHPAFGVGGDES